MAASSDNYIPRPDGDFTAWVNNYYDALKAWWAAHGYDPGDLADLKDAKDAWNAAWDAVGVARAALGSAAAAKKSARSALEPLVREFARFVQADQKTSNADRATIGLTVPDPRATPISTPTSRPLVRLVGVQRLQHRLRFGDEAAPTRTAKPRGAVGAEVWVAVVDPHGRPPPPGDAYKFIELASRGQALARFTPADAGKTACYALRWVSPRGERGPWSEVATATVAA